MELTLTRQTGTQVAVTSDGQSSHTFDLRTLIPGDEGSPHPIDNPLGYGKTLYTALFPPETPARRALDNMPERILLVATGNDLDAIPWEYAHGPYGSEDPGGFLVTTCHFVRGLPPGQRIPPPALQDTTLHIVAVPSNPLSHQIEPLNIDGEWMRLRDIISEIPQSIALERTRPPTIEQVRHLVAGKRQRVVHFMGHGGRDEQGAILCFEQDNGDLAPITAREFVQRVRNNVFLVTLNACQSAAPGETHFSNLAAALVRQKIPYALGMRFNILDDDARAFSREFYGDLARGTSVEEALLQARLTLARSKRPWVIGVPVLYTALAEPAAGFASHPGTPAITEHQPRVEAGVLPRAEGTFQGRINELKALGTALTGDSRPRIITIHGGGGQGKTALALEAIDRYAHAWPSGVRVTTLENLPPRAIFVADLARFLGINPQEVTEPAEVERQVLLRLASQRSLIVLDNAETLVEAVEARDAAAIQLAQFIQQLPGSSASLLVTSRLPLGWSGEVSLELDGLSPAEGAALFLQSAPQRTEDIAIAQAQQLSQKLDGYPLGLLLLAKAFNESAIPLQAFITDYEAQLLRAENKYAGIDHRHRTLYACIDTSVRYLNAELRTLFSKLWLFHTPFLPQTAAAIFDPQTEDTEGSQGNRSPIYDQLHTLWRRSLLTRETITLREGTLLFYRLLPTMHPYVEHYLAQPDELEALLARFGVAYAQLVRFLFGELNRGSLAAYLAIQLREDLERGIAYMTGVEQGYYLLYWGWILQRLVDRRRGLALTQQALKIAQELEDEKLKLEVFDNIAVIYAGIGQPQEALQYYEQALPISREVGDRAGEAATLNNMALVYANIGQPQQALKYYEQALPIRREVGDRAGEAATLNNMALVYAGIGQPQQALKYYEQALSIMREVGNRAGEAATLNNFALVYQRISQLQQALEYYEQALLIRRQVGDRTGEATTLNNLAYLYQSLQRYEEALATFEQSIKLDRHVIHPAGESAGLVGLALLLYRHLNRPQEAITHLEQAIAVLQETGLPQDAAGITVEDLQRILRAMRTGTPPGGQAGGSSTMPTEQIQQIISNTVAVMTTVQDRRAEWREAMAKALQDARQRGADWQIDVDFFSAVLDILDGQAPGLSADHPYAQAVRAIQAGIATGEPQVIEISEEVVQAIRAFVNAGDWAPTRQVLEAQQALLFRPEVEAIFEQNIEQAKAAGEERVASILEQHLVLLHDCKANGIATTFEQLVAAPGEPLPFDAQLVPRSVKALLGGPQERMEHAQYLATLSAQTTNEGLKALINTIQLALFGSDLSQLGQNLNGVYRQVWEAILAGIEKGGMSG
ncbi:MAG: tetratricopeptide repeat protein [Ktedonobacteraceae bacterium]